MGIFIELTLIIAVATVFAVLMRLLKQPLIVGYILAGVLAGPYFFNILHTKDHLELFSKIGITILLFIVGLNLNPKVIREVGKVSLITGVGQVIFTSLIGFLIALFLGIDRVAALYISIALTFSSTIVILKLLSDKGDLNKLYGRISIGFLLVQDVVAAIILLLISSFAKTGDINIAGVIGLLLIKALAVASILFLVSEFVLPKVSKFIASSTELLFLFSLTWGLGIATIFYLLGFSIEIGALIAGVILSLTPFAYEVGARLKPLRDFFIVLFFVLLGSQMALDNISILLLPAVVLSVFVLIGNPIIVIILMNLLGFKRKTGFMAGLTVAQISEFSLILAALGFSVGHLSREILSLITLVGIITITCSTYLILYADGIYPFLEKLLKFLELKKQNRNELASNEQEYDLILFGYDRVGTDFIHAFTKLKRPYLVVDFNPSSIQKLQENNIPYRFGDGEDIEFLQELNLPQVKMVVSTIPDFKTSLLMTKQIKQTNPQTIIIMLSHNVADAEKLYEAGATYVIMPHYLGSRYASNMITRLGLDPEAFKKEGEEHLSHIIERHP